MRRLLLALIVISVFLVVEVVGGLISGSLALLADAAHMGTDAAALALAASAHWVSRRPPNQQLHFGYQRAQVLAAFANGIALIGLLIWIVYEAVERFLTPVDVSWQPMLYVALAGLAANGAAFFILHSGERDNINIRGAMLHVVGDLLGSVVAVIAALTIAFSGWTRVDPILSVLVAILLARAAIGLLRETSHILLEGAPDHVDLDELKKTLRAELPEICDVHDVYIWQLTPGHPRMTLHAVVSESVLETRHAIDDVRMAIEDLIAARFSIDDTTIQLEIGSRCAERVDQEAPDALPHDYAARAHARHAKHDHPHTGKQRDTIAPTGTPALDSM